MATLIGVVVCLGCLGWLWNKFSNRISRIEGLLEDIADDIYDMKQKLGLKPIARTKYKFSIERSNDLSSSIQKEVAWWQGDTKKAIDSVKKTFCGKTRKYMTDDELVNLAEFAKECVEENHKKIQELVAQGKSYQEICKAFEGESEYRQGWYNYAYKLCKPDNGATMPVDPKK